jgi:hypothetical protein
MRAALFAALLGALVTAPAALAAAPPPTVIDFETAPVGSAFDGDFYAGSGVSMEAPPIDGEFCGGSGFAAAAAPLNCAAIIAMGRGSERSLNIIGGGELIVRFAVPQADISMWLSSFSDSQIETWTGEPSQSAQVLPVVTVPRSNPFARAAVLKAPNGAAAIKTLVIRTSDFSDIALDDLTFSPVPQPDTAVTSGPAAVTSARDGALAFAGNQEAKGFECSLDGGPAAPCSSPFGFAGLPDGQHTFAVAMRDQFGTVDATPAVWTWTIQQPPPPPPPPSAPDGDRDGVPDATDNCPAAANANQADGDGDGVGDACDVAPPGDVPPVTGRRVVAEVVSGEVLIKLPESSSKRRRLKQLGSGFIPLKGQAALPVGTVVDARKGTLAMASTVDGRRIGSGGRSQRATLSAGIFEIRQRKLKRTSRKKIPTDLVLRSAPGAEASCVSTGTSGPIKGRGRNTVRGLTASTKKGLFRIVGAAGISTAKDATWATRDRCDGTRTDVGKGKVKVLARASGKTVTVKAGRSYLVKAKLFRARQGRGR